MYYNIIPQAKLPRNVPGIFTYRSKERLNPGDLIIAEFRKTNILGVVAKKLTKKPQTSWSIKNIKKKIGQAPDYFVDLINWVGAYYFTGEAFIFDMITPTMPKRRLPSPKTSLTKILGKKFKNLKVPQSQLKYIKKILTNPKARINTFNLTTAAKFIAYYKLVEGQIKKKQTTILLTPTIADLKILLTYLPRAWQDKIVLLYSDIYTGKNRYWHTWNNLLGADKAKIIIGTRSAIFAPCKNLGLIILDQAEQDDYKQYDQNPRYDARKVALQIGELTGCEVVMFSDGILIQNAKIKNQNVM
jgi:primosomal protein N'